ncbi:MAG: Rrf2 family transcriptional regulator [Aeriscardovia aeriphila]|nr:Rrf2 family transcriptional regulator [Aeriscardovia aeriphila]
MRIGKPFENSVYVLLMLGSQVENKPVKSSVFSTLLGVSDSSLKKTLRRLVTAGFIQSSATRDGGYSLATPLEEITLGDVCRVMEGDPVVDISHEDLASHIFSDSLHHSQSILNDALRDGADAFVEKLRKVKLSDLLISETGGELHCDWQDVLSNRDHHRRFDHRHFNSKA